MSHCLRDRSGYVVLLLVANALLACTADAPATPSSGPSGGDREGEEDQARDDDDDGGDEDPGRDDDRDDESAEATPSSKSDAGVTKADSGLRDGGSRDTGAGAQTGSDAGGSDQSEAGDGAGEGGVRGDADAGAQPAPGTGQLMTCLPSANLAPGEKSLTLQVDGVSRSYLLHVPPGYSGAQPVPLVLDFHGLLLNADAQRGSSGYAELSDKEGFVVAFPNGIDNAWNVGPCCTQSREVDDVAFARALVAEIARLGCIDAKRVYSTGFSNGGGMTMQLACNAADLFAAVAPAAFDLLAEDEQPCRPARPIPIITFRGTSDFIVPYAGGASSPPNGLPVTIHFRGAEATFEFWKETNGCSGTPTMSNGCVTYSECAEGVQTTLCTKDGLLTGGHVAGDAALGWSTMKQYTLP